MPYFVIQSEPGSEEIARTNLERRRYEPFLPLAWARRTERGREIGYTVPLYPGYLFVRAIEEWGGISDITGVSRILGEDGKPGTVPDELITDLDRNMRMGGGAIIHEWQPKAVAYSKGDFVRITHGAWTGLIGEFQSMKHGAAKESYQGRVRVLLHLMGGKRTVGLRADWIAPVMGARP